jgi:dipeptidyl-peptidase-3
LLQYNDTREEYGSRNTLISNQMSANRYSEGSFKYLLPADREAYKSNMYVVRFVATMIHELLGYGTGRLFSETEPGKFNFNAENSPLNPLTGRKVYSWYQPGQVFSSRFEDIAQSVEECRAISMTAYLVDNKQLLQIFGYNENSELTANDLLSLSYLHLGVRSACERLEPRIL